MRVLISEYDLSFDYEYKLFESLNPVCQTAWKKLVASWLFASNTTVPTGYAYNAQVIGLPMQSPRGANFSTGGRPPTSPAGAGNNPGQVVHTRASVTKLQYNSVPVKGRPMPWE